MPDTTEVTESEEQNTGENPEQSNVLELSDEEFANLDPASFDASPDDNSSEEEDDIEIEDPEEEGETSDKKDDKHFDDKDAEDIDKKDLEAKSKDDDSDGEVDYKAFYDQVTAPFKANGKMMQVKSPEDLMTLKQQGANYVKKMTALKPGLKSLKMLENNDLLDERKLSNLIDLSKGDPAAIAKLLKDNNIDPLEMDLEKSEQYKPNTYTVGDKEVELDAVLDEIRDTESFSETINIVGTKWDNSSKQILYNNPTLIRTINEQVDNGIYQRIDTAIEQERALGRLEGMSDLEAYKAVGDALQANGSLDDLYQVDNSQKDTSANENDNTARKAQEKASKRKDKRKAASPPKAAPSKNNNTDDFNPLAMSDEEFLKLSQSKFM